jgi:hypothetical protein
MFGKDVENFPDFQRLSIFGYKISKKKVAARRSIVNLFFCNDLQRQSRNQWISKRFYTAYSLTFPRIISLP